jgi:putative flippase GtrA
VRTVHRWGRFNLVGSTGFVLQMAAVAVLTRGLGWHYGIATAIGVELAILNNFFWHSRYTWVDRPAALGDRVRRFSRYQLAKSLSLAANVGITAWLVSAAAIPVEAANVAAVAALSVVNFLVTDRMVFRPATAWPAVRTCRAAASSDRMSACRTSWSRR